MIKRLKIKGHRPLVLVRKRLLAPILLLTFLFPSLAYGETIHDLVKRDDLYYKKFTDVPFTGKITGGTQGTFKDGKEIGPWITYHDNGQLQSKGNYKDGKRDGPWVFFYKNGTKRFNAKRWGWDKGTGTYKNGVKVK